MSAKATLCVHAGGIRHNRSGLSTLPTPAPTRSWRPVPHAELVESLIQGLASHGITVAGDEYATLGRDHAKLFGVMRLRAPGLDTADFRVALALRAANDKSMSIQVVSGVNVFCCDNLSIYGDGSVVLRKRHTSRLDLGSVVPGAIDAFLAKTESFKEDIGRMQDFALTDGLAKQLIHDAFTGASPVLPLRCLPNVSRLYFDDHEQRDKFPDRSLWSLNNAFTEAVKPLKEVPRHNSGLRIGRYFGRVLHG